MENIVVRETVNILKRLSPANQSYFMTLVRLAEAAENGIKKELSDKPRRSQETEQQAG